MEDPGELGFMEIDAPAQSLERSEIFHLVKEIIGFVLYMHHQIPAILQHLEVEFDNLKSECKLLEESEAESRASSQRKHYGRIREAKQGIRRLEKLMNGVSSMLSALHMVLNAIPQIQGVTLILGGSLIRPGHVYEMHFSHGGVFSGGAQDSMNAIKSRIADGISKKAIRALVSNGAGSASYSRPTKLFLLVKAPATFNLPVHFLPKRDFRYNKKILPFKLHIKCRIQTQKMDCSNGASQTSSSTSPLDSSSNDMIWFQCRHVIKGLACSATSEDS